MFFDTLKQLLALLSGEERRWAYLLFCMVLIMAFLDMTGIASFMPLLSVLSDPDIVESNRYLAIIYRKFEFSDSDTFLYFLGIVVFCLLIFSIFFKALTTYTTLRFTHMRNYSISRRLVVGYLKQPYEWFLNRNSADLGKTVLSEVEKVIQGAMIPMIQLIAQGTVAAALIFLLLVVDPWLTIIVASSLCSIYGLIYLLLRRYLLRIGLERVQANKDRFTAVQETFGGIKDVKIGGLEGGLLKRFEEPAKCYARNQATSQVASYLPRYVLEAVTFGGMFLIVLYLMKDAGGLQKALPLIGLYAFAGYRLLPALQQVYAQLANLRFSKPALDMLHTDVQTLRSAYGNGQQFITTEPMGLKKTIKLDGVFYKYPGAARFSLVDLTLDVCVRTTVGIVGSSGAGKTTLVDLVLGLLSPCKGTLLIDDVVIKSDNIRSWQKTIGYVPQQIYLSDASIAANIAFGLSKEQINFTAVEEAARIANLHQFVDTDLPKGYETIVGERGVRLSGGQRQRIGIARALYHNPELLILDEATSALDNITEQIVMEAVHNLARQKTIIIIAHRLSTVQACDEIFLLEQGQLKGRGTYKTLLSQNEQFRDMAEGQNN